MATRDYAGGLPPSLGAQAALTAVGGWLLAVIRKPLVRAVVASRLLILAAGAYAALFTGRVSEWAMVDPTRVSSSLGTVGNVLTASMTRWDAIQYLSIAAHGYQPSGDTGFFPFYPLLIRLLGLILPSDVVVAILISLTSFVIALILLHRLTREEFGERVADATVLLLAFAPLSLFFTAIYTESLFLALSVGTFYLARRGSFIWACVTAACATVTHVEGITLFAPVAFMLWEAHGRRFSLRLPGSVELGTLLLPPAALLGLFFYMHQIGFGWFAPLTGANPTGHGYSIAPIPVTLHSPHLIVRSIDGPLVTLWRAVDAGAVGLAVMLHGGVLIIPSSGSVFSIGFQNLVYLVVLVITLTALIGTWRLLPKAYAIYATLVILVFTMSVVSIIPLRAFDRYMLPLFPLWMVAARWLEERRLLRVVLALSACALVFYTIEFARWSMIA